MNAAVLLRTLKHRVPEFAADDLFLDLPYVVFGEFASFIIERLGKHGGDDPVVRRAFDLVNDLFFEGDPETVNIIQTTLFEQVADDRAIAGAAHSLLEPSARTSLEQVAKWAGGLDLGA